MLTALNRQATLVLSVPSSPTLFLLALSVPLFVSCFTHPPYKKTWGFRLELVGQRYGSSRLGLH